jgi:membrane protein DedA with SNARE-associated domain
MDFSLAELSDSLLSWIVIYGPSMLFIALLLGALGVPVPGTFLVLASGAFVRQGVLDLFGAASFGLFGAMLGDTLSYGLGRFVRGPLRRWFGQSPAWEKAELNLRQRGGMAIYLTRWLLTPIAVPTNLVAGSTGYAFSSQWEALAEFISNFSGVLVGIALLGAGIYLIFRRWKTANGTADVLFVKESLE